jgi:hypothetical protein
MTTGMSAYVTGGHPKGVQSDRVDIAGVFTVHQLRPVLAEPVVSACDAYGLTNCFVDGVQIA